MHVTIQGVYNMTLSIDYKLIGYWEGYPEKDTAGVDQRPFPLNQIPDYFTHIPIAFCAPVKENTADKLATTWAFDSSFIYTKTQILEWVTELKTNRGDTQKILLSLMDTPDTHWSTDVDIPAFAKNLARDIYLYNLDGVDIDAESGMSGDYVGTFVLLIQSLREQFDVLALLHPELPKKIISYTCYTASDNDHQILKQTKDSLEYLTTMAYWDNTPAAKDLFYTYADWIGSRKKVGIGFACPPQGTNLSSVIETTQWLEKEGYTIAMLWSSTRDIQAVSGLPSETYGRTILAIFNKSLLTFLTTFLITQKNMLEPIITEPTTVYTKAELPAGSIEKPMGCFEYLCTGVQSLFCCLWSHRGRTFDDAAVYKPYASPTTKNTYAPI